jgi:hypothetical protein
MFGDFRRAVRDFSDRDFRFLHSRNPTESNLLFTSNNPLLNIQMESCLKIFRKLIGEISLDMGRSEMIILNILDYSKCSILLKELLQCVDYLNKKTNYPKGS